MDAPRTVLHVRATRGAGGGPDKTVLASPRHLEGGRYRALAAFLHPPRDEAFATLRARAAEQRCPLVELEERLPIDPRSLARLAALCRRERVRLWHAHEYKSNLYGWLLRRPLGLRLASTVHGWVEQTERTPRHELLDAKLLPRCDLVLAVSSDLEQRCLELGVARERLALVENAIDTELWRRTRPATEAPLRAELGVPPGRLVVGAAGRLAPEKGFELLIEAVGALRARGLDLELWIAGEGGERAVLEAARAALPEPERVRLLGYRADVRALLEAQDLFCLSSLREGLPNVVLEALAMEVPVVATRCGGMPSFAGSHEDLVLVEPGSSAALAHALEALARDPARRERLARRARERIVRERGFAARMRRVVELYDTLF